MNRIYLDEDRTIQAEMSSDASLRTDEINYRHRRINTRDLGFYFSLYCQQMKKQLSKHLNNIVRDFYQKMEIFLDDQTAEREESRNNRMYMLLKNWKPKLQMFEEKFLQLKGNLPNLSEKKKHKVEDFRKIKFVQILQRILSQVQTNNTLKQESSKMQLEHHINQAQQLYDQGRFEEAITRYKKISKTKSSADLSFLIGNCYKAVGSYKEGVHEYTKAIAGNPRGCYYNNRGNCFLCMDNIEKAEADYLKSIEIEPHNEVFLGNYGNICLTLKKFEEAIEVYNKALRIDPHNDFFYNNRAFAQIKIKRFSDAIESYNQAIYLSPLNHVYYKNRANLYMEKKKIDLALQDIIKAIQIEPYKHEYYFLKGKWEYLAKKSQEAMISFRRAYELEASKKIYKDYYEAIKAQLVNR